MNLASILSYGVLVILYCFLSPATLFLQDRRVKTTVANAQDAVFCVVLTGDHPILSILSAFLKFILIDPSMANDNAWATEGLLTARMLVPTSAFDLMAKLVMYLTTAVSLRKATVDLCDATNASVLLLYRRRHLHLNAILCYTWGIAVAIAMCRAVGFRQPCPSHCITHAYPMFDLSCRCTYANINCARLDIDDPSPLLDPGKIGTNLFYLQTSCCPLRDGLPKEMLEPFLQLSQISLFFTEMQSWKGPLPSTVNNRSGTFL
ncbi:unnamed protein product [Aphanomyces euteiches]